MLYSIRCHNFHVLAQIGHLWKDYSWTFSLKWLISLSSATHIFYIINFAYNYTWPHDSSLVIWGCCLNILLFNFHLLTSCLSFNIINNSNAATLIFQIKVTRVEVLFKHMLAFFLWWYWFPTHSHDLWWLLKGIMLIALHKVAPMDSNLLVLVYLFWQVVLV